MTAAAGDDLRPAASLAERVVYWQIRHGRHDLPWQGSRDPYRVWLSEIMLQQTQVGTVRDYFLRFIACLPNVVALAAAPLDQVLGLWSGLGYYSRARHLHRCAQQVVALHGGEFPRSAAQLQQLPGIGRSTAAAIAAFCFDERVAILDGNVRRVLSRVLGFAGDLAQAGPLEALWQRAEQALPLAPAQMPAYSQGLMDLGAALCRSRAPDCLRCPLQDICVAHQAGRPHDYPVRRHRLKRSSESWWLLLARTADGAVWLQRRPERGIWAALYALPMFDSPAALAQRLPTAWQSRLQPLALIQHALTHKDLQLQPLQLALSQSEAKALAALDDWQDGGWQAAAAWPALGLPAPLRRLLQEAASCS